MIATPRSAHRVVAELWLAAVLLVLPKIAVAWGFDAHRMVTRKAVEVLPEPLRSLFERNRSYLAEHSTDPDLWRQAGASDEAPNHFLDLDAFGSYPFAEIPETESDHLDKHGAKAADEGRVPWQAGESYRALVAAFRARDEAAVLRQAAVLAHYVADAHVPLHAAMNYDGQLTGQHGIHGRWETVLLRRFERQVEPKVVPDAPRAAEDPVGLVFAALRESFVELEGLLASDLAATQGRDLATTTWDDRYDDSYYSRLYERERGRLQARLAASATRVASLWLGAWLDAGRPPLDGNFSFPFVRGESRLVLVSLDGASAPLIEDAVARGVMPHLARLRAAGATARGAVSSRPARTAAAHAALFTGTWSDENGIDGNDMPLPGRSVLEIGNGYGSAHLRAEPLWVTAARQGLQVTVASATQVYPFEPFGKERRFGGDFGRRLTLFDGYQNLKAHDQVLTAASLPLQPASGWRHPLPPHEGVAYAVGLEVAGQRVAGLLYDSPEDEVSGLDTLDLRLDGDTGRGITLKPRPAAADPLAFARLTLERPGGQAGVHFRLFELSPDGSRFLLYGSAPHVLRGSRPRTESPAFEASGGFVGNGASRAYSRGELGPTLPQGGDGTAERRYLETVALVVRQLSRLNDFAIENTPWDVIITYLPCPDEFLHLWLGYLDPDLPGHDPELGSRLRPFVDEGLALADRFVGHLADRIDGDTLLAVASDHGQVAVSRVVRPNVALVRAGLLALDPEGEVDLARTRALYFPGNSGHVLVNSLDREGGIVTPEQEPHVRQEVVAALRSLRDPTTGEPVVRGVFDARSPGAGHGTDGPSASDLFLSLAPGYRPSPEWHGELTSEGKPWGDHLLDPERREMWAAFALAGPGVAAGVDLGTVRLIDVAPTLCALLGIDPPAAARGQILAEALQHQLPGR